MNICCEWAIEVDENRKRLNLEAQERFIIEFIGRLYNDIQGAHEELSKVQSLHFTRIFNPDRDEMGAYVRLRVFVRGDDRNSVEQEIDTRLGAAKSKAVFQIKKQDLDWEKVTENYGGRELATTFQDFLDSISRISFELLRKKQKGLNTDSILWPWTHFFFNAVRGYGRSIVEFPQGAVTDFIPNI